MRHQQSETILTPRAVLIFHSQFTTPGCATHKNIKT